MKINKGVVLAILCSFTFSIMNVLVKAVSENISSNQIAFSRGLIGTILILIIMKIRGEKLGKHERPLLITRGLLGGLYMVTYFFAISTMKLGDATILAHMSGLFVVLFSHSILKERLPRNTWIFAIIIFIGAMMIINPFKYSTYSFYAIFGLLSAVLSALATISIRKLAKTKEHSSSEIIFYFMAFSTVVAGVLMGKDFVIPSKYDLLLLLIIGTVSLLAQVFLTGALGNANAAIVEIIRYIGIAFNAGWGFVIFRETLPIMSVIGGIIIVAGSVLLSQKKDLEKKLNRS